MTLKSDVHVTNPGGHDGSNGQQGTSGRGIVVDGADGADGTVEIFVEGEDGKFMGPYRSQYHIEALDFDIVDGNDDGVFEFGELLTVQNIRIRNIGDPLL
jgi:hypothetical protein